MWSESRDCKRAVPASWLVYLDLDLAAQLQLVGVVFDQRQVGFRAGVDLLSWNTNTTAKHRQQHQHKHDLSSAISGSWSLCSHTQAGGLHSGRRVDRIPKQTVPRHLVADYSSHARTWKVLCIQGRCVMFRASPQKDPVSVDLTAISGSTASKSIHDNQLRADE